MATSFWSKIYAVTRWTNYESLGEHPMCICLVQRRSQATGIGQAPAVCKPMVLLLWHTAKTMV